MNAHQAVYGCLVWLAEAAFLKLWRAESTKSWSCSHVLLSYVIWKWVKVEFMVHQQSSSADDYSCSCCGCKLHIIFYGSKVSIFVLTCWNCFLFCFLPHWSRELDGFLLLLKVNTAHQRVWPCVLFVWKFCELRLTGEVDLVGLKPILRNTTSFSALTLLVGSFDPQKPSPKWPIMCLVGR